MMREHWNSHGATYVCCFIFIITTIVISMLSWAVILRPVERTVENPEKSLPVHVFINQNDTIMPRMMDDLKEMKGMIEDIQSSDTLCLMITKGGK